MRILGVDPGRSKTGLAVLESDGSILWRAIIAPADLGAQLPEIIARWQIGAMALGDSTSSAAARARIEAALKGNIEIAEIEVQIVDERGSTLEARDLYWADHARRGWRALVPLSMQEPPAPIDDYAAAVVARRALAAKSR